MQTIILTGIFIILLLDFYLKNSKLIKKSLKKTKEQVIKKPELFMVRHKGHGEKIADELNKEL